MEEPNCNKTQIQAISAVRFLWVRSLIYSTLTCLVLISKVKVVEFPTKIRFTLSRRGQYST